MPYEYHYYDDPKLKLFFHEDRIKKSAWFHWHKSPEFLLVLDGQISVNCDGIERKYVPGEIAIINNNEMHLINACYEEAVYFCLIVDSEICDLAPLPHRSSDPGVVALYKQIAKELQERKLNYREAVIGYIKAMIALLSRESVGSKAPPISRKMELTKAAIEYMYCNFQKELSLEKISTALNFNKYYLSHIFKENTGKTVMEHLNYIRCSNAFSMLSSGKYNVTQSAYASGFSNLSYFCKTYKKIIGNNPASDIPRQSL